MATLSDLLDPAIQSSAPSWIAALNEGSEFIETSFAKVALSDAVENTAADKDDALARAFAEGEQAGRAACEAEIQSARQTAIALKSSFDLLDKSARNALAQHLADTVAILCEQLIDQHLIDNAALSRRCVKLAEMIGESAASCVLHIHPDDTALLDPDWATRWAIRTNAALNRGTLRLEGPDGMLCDGPDEWRRAISTALKS